MPAGEADWASRTNRSSSDSRRGESDRTDAPAASAARRKASTSTSSGSSKAMARSPATDGRAPAGSASPASPCAGGRSTTSVDSRRADSRSPSGPTLRSTPPITIATRSQVISTSGRICVEKKIVFPSLRSSRIRSRTSLRPSGSRPVIGSSRITSSGSAISACAIPIRCNIPFENLRSGRPRAWPRPTRSISRSARARRSADGSAHSAPMKSRNSSGVR